MTHPAGDARVRSWAMLLVLTAIAVAIMRAVHLPAAWMLGPMAAGLTVAIRMPGAQLPRGATLVAQAVLGCLIAQTLSPALLGALAVRWPVLVGMNLLTVIGTLGLGIATTRLGWLPGTAGIWGMSPGAASTMVLLSDAYGGDRRLVAVMQYLRLLFAAGGVMAAAALLGTAHHAPAPLALPGGKGVAWLAWNGAGAAMAAALVLAAVAGTMLARRPTIAIFLPIFGGVAVQVAGLPAPAVPPILSAAAFVVVGWRVGLSFTLAALIHIARLLPRIVAGIVAILLLCAGVAALMATLTGETFLTAYMALNPGGTDVVLATAATVSVDLPLILAMQVVRLVVVIALAPALGRMAAGRHLATQPSREGSGGNDAAATLAEQVDEVA